MSQLEFFKPPTKIPSRSEVRLIAGTINFQIKLVEALSASDAEQIIKISQGLIKPFGLGTAFTKTTVWKYFNYPHTLPFVGLLRNEIIGFLVGVPLENFQDENWASIDPTLGEHETVYTYAFIFDEKHQKNGYAKMLKRVYINWLKKRGYLYVCIWARPRRYLPRLFTAYASDSKIPKLARYWQSLRVLSATLTLMADRFLS